MFQTHYQIPDDSMDRRDWDLVQVDELRDGGDDDADGGVGGGGGRSWCRFLHSHCLHRSEKTAYDNIGLKHLYLPCRGEECSR